MQISKAILKSEVPNNMCYISGEEEEGVCVCVGGGGGGGGGKR